MAEYIDRAKIHKAIPAEEDNCTGIGMSYAEMDAYNNGIDAMYALVMGMQKADVVERSKIIKAIEEIEELETYDGVYLDRYYVLEILERNLGGE